MAPSNVEVAEAFSWHRFAETYDHLAADIRWMPIGSATLEGRDAVIAACEQSSEYLATCTTEFRSFRTVVGTDSVVVDTLTRYVDPDREVSVVASCDIYDFAAGQLTAITSYTVELAPD